jgi:predicted HicB family RNase H-like nuclease
MEKIFPIRINNELHRKIKHAAIDEGITLHNWITQAIEEKADNNSSKVKHCKK